MPDDILMIILSRLNLKEAVETSILSRRWRFVWTYLSGVFDFDAQLLFFHQQLIGSSRNIFAETVGNTLKQHQGPTIAELRIRFPKHLDNQVCEHQLHSWIDMGVKKRVKSLLIDFRMYPPQPMQPLSSFSSFTSLISLRLVRANISAEMIHHLLSNTPALEVLSIVDSLSHFHHLKLCGPCLRLKHLELRYNAIWVLEISAAPYLESLELYPINRSINIFYKDVPSLTRVSYGLIFCKELVTNSLCPQLESLTMMALSFRSDRVYEHSAHFPAIIRNLKEIHVALNGNFREDFHSFFRLIDASPVLTKASFRMFWSDPYENLEFSRHHDFISRPKHQSLKVVEIFGFNGSDNDHELVTYLVHYAANLHKISVKGSRYRYEGIEGCRFSKLKSMLPPSVKLEILE
ncbi:putative FBD-associated F-box protein At5g56700 [Mercurialis annua]|uniref:putative FBD-associated F-box protein At5g56700 n=1 Tax=Mercurialis annua TaxID=3986 RepID=UPI0024AF6AFF|nr:putative FBD-associated F-box protein At5g56700 [Mercurialis annua]